MKNALSMSVAAAVVACAGSAAMADFFPGQTIQIHGTATGFGDVIPWGDGQPGNGPHQLGGPTTTYTDPIFGPSYFIEVNSTIHNVNLLTLTFDLNPFFPNGYVFEIDVLGLKTDGTILSVFSNYGTATVNPDGNGFHWTGGPTHPPAPGLLVFEIVQSPTPGAAALLGLGGLAAARRRR